jgi:putative FmdB family regulatory protein
MPIYEYECRGCGHCFEALIRDATAPACPSSQSVDLERMVSLFGVSSESTRQSNLRSGRKQNVKERRDKAIADREEIHHH